MLVDFSGGQVECCMASSSEFCIRGPWAKGVPELSGKAWLMNIVQSALFQSVHAGLLGEGCCGQLWLDMLTIIRLGVVGLLSRASCSSQHPV